MAVEFGTPETWGMKVGDFLEQKEFTIPQEKPKELLDLQEQNRKQRLLDSLQKIGPGLMDESLDFIRRKNFDKGSPGRPLGSKGGRIPLAEQDKYLEDIRKAYNKLKKDLGRNPTQGEILKATGKKAQTAVRTATKKFGLELFNKPGEYNVPLEVLQEARKKQTERMQAAKKIEGPTTFQQDRVLKDVKFPNKKMENAFKANVKLYFSYPFGSAEGQKVGATIDSFKKFYPDPKSVSNDTVRRHVNFFRDKLNLKFPLQTYEGDLKRKTILGKEREKLIREVSDFVKERQMVRAKKETGFGRLGENLDLAHRASLKQFKDFNLPYQVDNLGLDTRKLNQVILPPLEREINSAHRERMRLIKNVKPGKVPKEVSKKLEDINLKLSKISLKTNGALQAVLLDEKTLEPFVFNKNYANVIGQGILDKPVKELTEADIDFIKTGFPDLAKEAKKIPEKKLTALQELASRTGAGLDPILAAKAGYEEIVKPAGKGLLTALKVLGQPSVAAAFAADELRQGNLKTAGSMLLAPELVGSFAPKGRGLLSLAGRIAANPFGKFARAFTPVGLATIGAGALKDVYDEYQRREALTDEERLEEDIERDRAADEMMIGAAEGGRIGFADGPKDPSKRKFMKLMGIMSLLPFGIGKGFKMLEKTAPVVAEGAKLGFDKFMMLVNKIKELGTPTGKVTQKEREMGYTYTGKDGSEYELIEDLTTGDLRVTKDKPGVAMGGDKAYDVIEDRSTFVLKKGQADETTKGKTPPDEYDEVKEVASPDGTFDDVDEISDEAVKEVLDEIN